MPKPVIHAELNGGFFIPGIKNGNFTKTLPNPNKTLKNFAMTLQDNGNLYLEWEDDGFVRSYTVSAGYVSGCVHPPVPVAAIGKKSA
jgi:hypothetical protein